MEDVVRDRMTSGDEHLTLVGGADLVSADQLGDGIHPSDDGHRAMAAVLGPALAKLVEPAKVA
jgi:lysophospholipase L1-like esterase